MSLQESLERRSATEILRLGDLLLYNKAFSQTSVLTLHAIRPSAKDQ